MARINWNRWVLFNAAGTLYRQTLLPVRLNIYFQQHLHIADESIATVNVNNQPDAGTDGTHSL
jgi:hypothetical protein